MHVKIYKHLIIIIGIIDISGQKMNNKIRHRLNNKHGSGHPHVLVSRKTKYRKH